MVTVMGNTNEEFLEILANNLSNESKWFLTVLMREDNSLHKEELRDLANNSYRDYLIKKGEELISPLIPSRHGLDIHTARLEGAGLVSVKEYGRVRRYSITPLGEALLGFIANYK